MKTRPSLFSEVGLLPSPCNDAPMRSFAALSIGEIRKPVTWTLVGLLFSMPFAIWELIRRVQLELLGAVQPDAYLYFTVGRGILNGLLPYKDLFETKPPGMFLLSALSLWITNGPA